MKKKIKSFPLSQLTLGATCDFHAKVKKAVDASGAAALHIESLDSGYSGVNVNLQSVVNRQTAFVATLSLKETDAWRDRLTGIINGVVNTHLTNPIEAKRAAATRLKAVLSPYTGIGKHEYAKQTAEVKGMQAVLTLPENAEAIAALHLDEEVTELQKANEAFEAAFEGKITEAVARDPQKELDSKELCDEANALYGEIVETVNAYAIVQPTDEINDFIDRVNGIVAVYTSIVDGSASGGGSTPTEPTDPSEGEGEGEGEDGKDDEGTDLPFEPTDPNPDEGGEEEEETPSVV